MWTGHIVIMEQHRIPKKVLEEEGQWGDHEIDGKLSYRGMQPTCSGFGNERLQQEIGRSGGRRLGTPGPKNGPKRRRRRIRRRRWNCILMYCILCSYVLNIV
jgi:hypothetical protein